MIHFFLLTFSNLFSYSYSLNEETILRNDLISDYNKYVRPVNNYNDILNVNMGLAVQNLEEFNQIKETMDLNIWVRMDWKNDLLYWNSSQNNISFLSINIDNIWTPDIELLNGVEKPEIYIINEALNLYSDGSIFRSKPGIFRFSCALDLKEFPFDIQTCKMKFGSWTYNNDLMYILPYEEPEKQIDVLSSFSHSEWEIKSYNLLNYNETRLCCPGKNFSINEYTFELQRFPHYYKLSMGMTISLVIVSFIIMLIKPDNVSRTGTAVFIPLTILALQLTIADKIPVVGYYTLMDNFFLCCFITSMFVSIESGLIFSLTTTKNNLIYNVFYKCFNIEKLYRNYTLQKVNNINRKEQHDLFIKRLNETNNTNNNLLKETNQDDFDTTINALNNSNSIQMKNIENIENIENINEIDKYNIVDKDIIRVINFDDENLNFSLKQKLVFDRIEYIFSIYDNIFRVLLPLIFFIYISYIMSHEK